MLKNLINLNMRGLNFELFWVMEMDKVHTQSLFSVLKSDIIITDVIP